MDSSRRRLVWDFLGSVPYRSAFALQLRLRQALKEGRGPEHLLLLEHPHVYTLGRNAHQGDIVGDAAWREARGVTVEETDRGGQVTYHGPGQLVGYPLLNLSPDRRDVRRFVRDLQEVLIRTAGDFGVVAERRDGPEHVGVWVGQAKLASIGVHLSHWLTTHGFALNVTTDLSFFGGIVPCGLHGVTMTSLAQLCGQRLEVATVAARVAVHTGEVFARALVRQPVPVEAA